MLDEVLAGHGQVCFLSGEAGAGKTALSAEFQRQAQERHPELLIAGGACDAQVGDETPYAPFREVLESITESARSRAVAPKVKPENGARVMRAVRLVAEVLAKFGPDLVGVFIPGTPFIGKMADFVLDQAGIRDKLKKKISVKQGEARLLSPGALSQDQVIEQFVNVLRELATKAPILLVLDDLHWADSASIDLLFRLCRRLVDARLFVLCAFRPHDVKGGRGYGPHPLERVVYEVQRYRGDVWLDLTSVSEQRGRDFVGALIDAEPNRLDAGFRQRLYAHTEGHPLFTVELLRDLKSREILKQDEQGAWTLTGKVDWDTIPARIEGVVASRLSTVDGPMRDTLNAAAVEGDEFTAEVLARLSGQDPRLVIRQLSGELQDELQIVRGLDTRRIGAQRISRYRFGHQLFQRYVYESLDSVEKSYLHEGVGLALEALYGQETDQIAAALARHFEAAEMTEKARHYLGRAGHVAAAAYANASALAFFDRAMALTPADARAERIDLLSARERVSSVLGLRDRQREDLATLDTLATAPGDAELRADVLYRRAQLALEISDYPGAISAAMALEASAAQASFSTAVDLRVEAPLIRAIAHFRQSDWEACRAALTRSLDLSRASGLRRSEARALQLLASLRWARGDLGGAHAPLAEALGLARAEGDLRVTWSILNDAGVLASEQRDFIAAARHFAEARGIVGRTGQRAAEARLLINEGDAAYETGNFALSRDCALTAYEIALDVRERRDQAISASNLTETLIEVGDFGGAQRYAAISIAVASEIGYRRGACITREYLSRIALATGDFEAAIREAKTGLSLAADLGLGQREASLQIPLARALIGAGRIREAMEASATARLRASELGLPALIIQADAARALALLARRAEGDLAEAVQLAEPASAADSAQLGRGGPAEAPLWTRLTQIETLCASNDARAASAARVAIDLLKQRAQRISDSALRQKFIDGVPEHRELQRLHAALQAR